MIRRRIIYEKLFFFTQLSAQLGAFLWRSKVCTSCTNETNFKPGTSHMDTRFNQIDHCLIDGRHFSDVIDVMARRGANIDSDHMLVVIKLRARICRASNTKPQQLRRFTVDRLKGRRITVLRQAQV
jgi:hypothetical protein